MQLQRGEFKTPIKCIIIENNNHTDRNRGFAMVQSGGVNYRHVFLYFRGDVNFNIDIYGDTRNVRPNRPF